MNNNKICLITRRAAVFLLTIVFLAGIVSSPQIAMAQNTTPSSQIITESDNHTTDPSLIANLNKYISSEQIPDLQQGILDAGIKGTTTSMPSIGDVKLLIFAVEFPDVPFEENIEETLTQNFFGDADERNFYPHPYPLESMKAFYERSSFNKLHFSGNIVTYTASHNRSYYNDNMNEVIEEVLLYLEAKLTTKAGVSDEKAKEYLNQYLKQYDSNNDSILDGVYLFYSGGTSAWGEQWWSYVGYYNGYTIGDYTFGSTCIFGDYEPCVIIHETGHMLGLDDYYDYETKNIMAGIHSLDMMQTNLGDHNVFSKLLLGWIEPENVKIISDNIETVQLSECSEAGDCIIILPNYKEETGLYTEFYLVTYREFIKNNTIRGFDMPKGGLCIYYVNATLTDNKTEFLYSNRYACKKGTVPLIRQIHQDNEKLHSTTSGTTIDGMAFPWPWMADYETDTCFYHEGDEFTPYTCPSSNFFSNGSWNDDRIYTGITVNNIGINNGIASFHAGIEKTQQKYDVTYTVDSPSLTADSINNLRADVYLSTDVTMPAGNISAMYISLENTAKVTDCNNNLIGYLSINLSKLQNGVFFLNDTLSIKNKMEPGNTYKITIPQGTFRDALGKEVDEIQFEYNTNYKAVTTIELNKKNLTLDFQETYTLDATIFPNDATCKTYYWLSSNPNVAKVNSNGKVTAVGLGTAIITATAEDGSEVIGSCEVTVMDITNAPTPFSDVEKETWYYKFIQKAYVNNLMSGVGINTETGKVQFNPLDTMSRAQFVQVLYSMHEKPSIAYTNHFPDVPDPAIDNNAWYSYAVLWAASNGITSGKPDGSFGVNDNITREQMAVMLMKCAELSGNDVSDRADLSSFTDTDKINSWAIPAMQWAIYNEIMSGTLGGELMPNGYATRAEGATMLNAFYEKFN